ncbi:hypothetical protein PAXRUDRAFT_821731 [Paxillus rubicundulus Ve08.2h10]|uniref:Uncharacterized protein n=1 Tax=Paxillus rubicundulus Ve08.2h10 TaxID=930991 RepID=A0A0D0DNB6_9AGAM|nr:hypothetical protein PAXRUDRAFT_821731 [Paxillus rubicundulus Ve08.2h10]
MRSAYPQRECSPPSFKLRFVVNVKAKKRLADVDGDCHLNLKGSSHGGAIVPSDRLNPHPFKTYSYGTCLGVKIKDPRIALQRHLQTNINPLHATRRA